MKKKIILVGLISIFGLTISKTAYAKAILTDPYNDACNYVDGYKIEYNTLDYNKHYTSSSAASYNNHPKDELFGENVGKFYVNFYDKNYNLVCETDSASGYVNYKSSDYTYMTITWQMEKYADMPCRNLGIRDEIFPGESKNVTYKTSETKVETSTVSYQSELSSTISVEIEEKYFDTSSKISSELVEKNSVSLENSKSVSFQEEFTYEFSIENSSDLVLYYGFQIRAFYEPYIVEYFELDENTDEVYHYNGFKYFYKYVDSSEYLSCKGFEFKNGTYKIYSTYKSPNYVYFD